MSPLVVVTEVMLLTAISIPRIPLPASMVSVFATRSTALSAKISSTLPDAFRNTSPAEVNSVTATTDPSEFLNVSPSAR